MFVFTLILLFIHNDKLLCAHKFAMAKIQCASKWASKHLGGGVPFILQLMVH